MTKIICTFLRFTSVLNGSPLLFVVVVVVFAVVVIVVVVVIFYWKPLEEWRPEQEKKDVECRLDPCPHPRSSSCLAAPLMRHYAEAELLMSLSTIKNISSHNRSGSENVETLVE